MSKILQAKEYFKYLLRSIHLHGIHSPFVYELNEKLFKEKAAYYAFDKIEAIRAKLLLTEKIIQVEDFGAGSKRNNASKRKISEIAKSALKSPVKAQLLFRIAHHFKPTTILELGTSFGITTSYFAKARPQAKIITLEGSEEIAKVATVNLKKLNIHNVKPIVGKFEDTLKTALDELKQLDLVFLDGNHKKNPTLEYFEKCLDCATEESVFIFDDIYWSAEMKSAWAEIKSHPKVTVTIDCFEMGVVFFKKDQAKEHFTVYH